MFYVDFLERKKTIYNCILLSEHKESASVVEHFCGIVLYIVYTEVGVSFLSFCSNGLFFAQKNVKTQDQP